jgi:glucokinase
MTVLAFDIGGTRIKAGLVTEGQVSSLATIATEERSATAVLARIVALGREVAGDQPVDAVGVSVRGVVDPETGALIDVNPPLACLAGQPLQTILASEFEVPAQAENDARMYALGELRHGAGRAAANMVCLTLGTGIGLGVALCRRMLRGARGVSGILGGHFTIDLNGSRCGCGNVGCLETLIGGNALVRHATEQLRAGESSTLVADRLDPRAIFASAAAGDPVARQTVGRFTAALGSGVVTMIHAYDPDVVVLGGGLSASAEQFLPQLRAYVGEHAWTHPRGRVQLVVSELGDAAALVGAAELATDDTWAW